jgi:glycosyltransferase involved in cell wall biosynthesis
MIKVRMYPHLHDLANHDNGIAQVIKHYFRYLPDYDIELVDPMATSYDLEVAHAAAHPGAQVVHSHGNLWTGEMPQLGDAAHVVNRDLVRSYRLARQVTVPSPWVAMPFQRDMRVTPHIIPHGVEWEEWQHNETPAHILWAKNRATDGLDPSFINRLAKAFPSQKFISTLAGPNQPANLQVLGGAVPSGEMKRLIQQSLVFIASDRETFGIAPLEAMASGVPVLTVDAGEVPNFLLRPGKKAGWSYRDFDDAVMLLEDILYNRRDYSTWAKEIAKSYSWPGIVAQVATVYRLALQNEPPSVDIVIPCHNYHHTLERALQGAMGQSSAVKNIIVVDDSSDPGIQEIVAAQGDSRISYHRVEFGNVALARNYGARQGQSKYLAFLDADDNIEPGWSPILARELERDGTLGVAYTSMLGIDTVRGFQKDSMTGKIRWDDDGRVEDYEYNWPFPFDYQKQLAHINQVPSGCMIRRKAFERAGGYMPLYAPDGAGSEDAELWLRLGAMGWGASYVVDRDRPSRWLHYSGVGHVSGKMGYEEPDWTLEHPWTSGGVHPFASIAQPVNGIAHPVYSYEKPEVSIIIPVGPGHEGLLVNCLHCIEGQTMREWAAVVVWDGVENETAKAYYRTAFPFVTYLETDGVGAGAARNAGVGQAKGAMLAFVDADDRILPEYLAKHYRRFQETGKIPYSDFIALVDEQYADSYGPPAAKIAGGKAYIPDKVPEWRCEKATAFPQGPIPYTAAGTNILIPREWMIPFDETLETWEDNLLILQLSWSGRQFTKIAEPLWIYDLASGRRRIQEPDVYARSLTYIQQKFNEVERMCNCDNDEKQPGPPAPMEMSAMDVIYQGFGGEQWLVGAETGKRYTRVTKGDVVKNVDSQDVRAQVQIFACAYCRRPLQFNRETAWCDCGGQPRHTEQVAPAPRLEPVAQPEPVERKTVNGYDPVDLIQQRREAYQAKQREREAPKPIVVEEPLSRLPINFRSLKALEEKGITTLAQAQALGPDGLLALPGVGQSTVDLVFGSEVHAA